MLNKNYKITTNTEHIAIGDVFFCFYEAEKYLTLDTFKKSAKIYATKGFKNRIKKKIQINSYKDKINENFRDNLELKKKLIKELKQKYYKKEKPYLIAITGTKGKTTTAWFAAQNIVNYSNIKCGYIGTLGVYIFEKANCKPEKIKNYTLTTPNIDELYFYINLLKNEGAKVIVFEVSSHALSQGRIDGLKISCGCFTNFSEDHLDYHKTMEEYFKAKSLLFSKYLDKNGLAIINSSDKKSKDLINICKNRNIKTITIGFNKGDNVSIKNIGIKNKKNELCSYADIISKDFLPKNKQFLFKNIIGDFNIQNALEALSICYNYFNHIKSSKLEKIQHTNKINIKCPPGRLELINFKNDNQSINNPYIIVDFAHTPKSIEEVLKLLRDNFDVIFVVFGCGGDRDKKKRPIMFEIVLHLADVIFITSDNSRSEKTEDIINDITCYYNKNKNNPLYKDKFVQKEIKNINNSLKNFKKCNFTKYSFNKINIEVNREKAINSAIKIAKSYINKIKAKCCILVAGKGDEEYQIIGNEKKHFNDKEVILKILSKQS